MKDMNEVPISFLIHDLQVHQNRLEYLKNQKADCELIDAEINYIYRIQDQMKFHSAISLKDFPEYDDPQLTTYPSTDGIGYIPTCEELHLAFMQLADAKTWPSDTIKYELKVTKQSFYMATEEYFGTLTFYKIDGKWHYNGFVKNS